MLEHVRELVRLLPETGEADGRFDVAGMAFARVDPGGLHVLVDGDWQAVETAAPVDWVAVEDRVARAWELAAPDRLLEAGGR